MEKIDVIKQGGTDKEDKISLVHLIKVIIRYRISLLILNVIFFLLFVFYMLDISPIYQVKAKYIISNANGSNIFQSSSLNLSGVSQFGNPLFPGSNTSDQMIGVMLSNTVTMKAAKDIDYINVYTTSFLGRDILAPQKKLPFSIEIDKEGVYPLVTLYFEILSKGKFRIYTDELDTYMTFNYLTGEMDYVSTPFTFDHTYRFGEDILLGKRGRIRVNKKPFDLKEIDRSYVLKFRTYLQTAAYIRSKTRVEHQDGGFLNVTYTGDSEEEGVTIIDALYKAFVHYEVGKGKKTDDKEKKILELILKTKRDSLEILGERMINFQESTNLSSDVKAQAIFSRVLALDVQLSDLDREEEYLSYLSQYLEKRTNSAIIAPSLSRTKNPSIYNLYSRISQLNNRKEVNSFGLTSDYPSSAEIDNQIEFSKKTLRHNIGENVKSSRIARGGVEKELRKWEIEMSKMPRLQYQYLFLRRAISKLETQVNVYEYKYESIYLRQLNDEASLTVLDPPLHIDRPPFNVNKKKYVLIFGTLIAGVISILMVFLVDFIKDLRLKLLNDEI